MSKEKLYGDAINKIQEFLIARDGKIYLNGNIRFEGLCLTIEKIIDQTREETIRECEGVLPEENYGHEDNCSTEYKNGWNDCREEIKQSLINLRSK